MNAQRADKRRWAAGALTRALAGLLLLALALLAMGARASLAVQADGPAVRYVAPTGTDSGDCKNSAAPCRTVQYAVDRAGPGDEIRIAAGTYTETNTRPVPDGYPHPPASGVITQVAYVSRTVTLRGGYTTNWTAPDPAANPTTLDAGGRGRGLVVAGFISATVEGLRFTGGNAAGLGGAGSTDWIISPQYAHAGGGIYVTSATLTLSGCHFYSNTASMGAGLHLRMSENAMLTGNTFISNTATSNGGGLLIHASRDILLDANTFISNTATSNGGGLWLGQSRTVVLTGNRVISNTAQYGGGLETGQCENVSLTDNTAGRNGGGLRMSQSDTVTLTQNPISGNTAGGDGGGLHMLQSYTVTLTQNPISGNTAGRDGGGLYLDTSDDNTLTNNTISGNQAAKQGGGVRLNRCYRNQLDNNIIADNSCSVTGAGLYVTRSRLNLRHNTVARNTGGDGSGISIGSRATTAMTNTLLVGYTIGITVTAGSTATLQATL